MLVQQARVRRYLQTETCEVHDKDSKVALTDKDFAAHVVAKGLNSVVALQAWVARGRAQLRANRHALSQEVHMVPEICKAGRTRLPTRPFQEYTLCNEVRTALIGMEAYMFQHQAAAYVNEG